MNWYDPQNWMDMLDHAWYGVVLIVVAAIPSIISAKNHKGISKIQDQVVNGHKDPLRKDLDKVMQKLSETSAKVDSISSGVHNLRQELIDEESRRRAHISDLRDEVERKLDNVMKRFEK